MASSNAAIIVNMDACENKLGISKKIYSLSIPLGATVNMDGTCIYLVIFGMALARVFGVDINGGMMLSMFFSVFVLSVGAPGVPGAGLVCLSVLLTQLNVPLAGIGLVMGLDSLLGMMRAMSNSLGDVTASLIVAKSEKKLEIARKKESYEYEQLINKIEGMAKIRHDFYDQLSVAKYIGEKDKDKALAMIDELNEKLK